MDFEGLVRTAFYDALRVSIYESREHMARAASKYFAHLLREPLSGGREVSVMFATGASQREFLSHLTAEPDLAWSRVRALHMDEYVGISPSHPASFRNYLREHLVSRVPLAAFYGIEGDAADPLEESRRYAQLFDDNKPEICAMGIGENGHIAFNDPPVADFADRERFKIVELDAACRAQQVYEGWFPDLDAVPRQAITATVPTLMSIPRLVIVVPGPRKTAPVTAALLGPVAESCPASILRRHANAHLFLDREAAQCL
jgi:glucosamine-6-phosphate deaminase